MSKIKLFFFSLIALMVAVMVTSCSSSKNVAYIQNIEWFNSERSAFLYDARIMPKDILTITVNTGPLPDDALLSQGANLLFHSMQEFCDEWENVFSELSA